jgi:hypothetical protein
MGMFLSVPGDVYCLERFSSKLKSFVSPLSTFYHYATLITYGSSEKAIGRNVLVLVNNMTVITATIPEKRNGKVSGYFYGPA